MRNYRNRALGLPFRMRERLRDPRPLMGYGCFLNSSMVARWVPGRNAADIPRFIGAAGFDFAMIDWEHTPMCKWIRLRGLIR
jgi:2-keto-3-deoxy-L-rhamnonate aldolase RhmA